MHTTRALFVTESVGGEAVVTDAIAAALTSETIATVVACIKNDVEQHHWHWLETTGP